MLSNVISVIKDIQDIYLVKFRWQRYEIGSGFRACARVRILGKNMLPEKTFI